MLTIIVPGSEHFNQETQEFLIEDDFELELEHSLATLSKWESIYEKPFIGKDEKTREEVIEYVKIMVRTPNVPPDVFTRLSPKNFEEISEYINSKQSATWFREMPGTRGTGEAITAELIYYWVFSANIPLECEHWHLNKLFTLLRVFGVKNGKQKKMPRNEAAAQRAEMNAKRRAQYGTSG